MALSMHMHANTYIYMYQFVQNIRRKYNVNVCVCSLCVNIQIEYIYLMFFFACFLQTHTYVACCYRNCIKNCCVELLFNFYSFFALQNFSVFDFGMLKKTSICFGFACSQYNLIKVTTATRIKTLTISITYTSTISNAHPRTHSCRERYTNTQACKALVGFMQLMLF